jgi:cation:H+ antiporter
MTAVAIACLPILFTGHSIKRWEGLLFVAYAGIYTTFLVLQATDHRALDLFTQAMLVFVLPLTAVTIALVTARSIRAGRWRATWR